MKQNKVLHVVFDSDMRCSHIGLKRIALKLKLDIDQLEMGQYIIFINSRKTMVKIFTSGNTIAHFAHPLGHKIDMRMIAMIPSFFNGKQLQYDDAMKALLLKEIGIRKK